jgi:serine/threonine protein kinase
MIRVDLLDALQHRIAVSDRGASCKHVHAALTAARAARARFADLAAATELTEPRLAALLAVTAPFSDAARAFDTLQQQLRDAAAVDLDVVHQRNAARTAMCCAAVAVVDASNRLLDARRQLQRGRAVLAEWPRLANNDDDTLALCDDGNSDLAWLSGLRTQTQVLATLTEEYAHRLTLGLTQFAAALAPSQDGSAAAFDAAAQMERSVLASMSESALLAEMRMPRCAAAAMERRFGALLASTAFVPSLVARARAVRDVKAPDDRRLQAAQDRLQLARREVTTAEGKVAHPLQSDDVDELRASLALLRAECTAASKEKAAAVIELGAALFDFPELVLRYPIAQLDVLAASVGALRTLGAYDGREKIAGTLRVERASIDGEVCALKLFDVGERGQRAFLKEARQLRQLTHANVVQLRAAFVDDRVGVIEMPLYRFGSLWKWLAGAQRASADKVDVLRQTLCGLAHVHRMGVVHGDVKPDNVFVDAVGVAKLGDFDVSHDDSATHATTTVGVTIAYCAPELATNARPSKASDMFAFGLTVFDLMLGVEQPLVRPANVELLAAHELANGGRGLRDLVGALIAPEASDRSSASHALVFGAFAPAAPLGASECRSCVTCWSKFHVDDGLECGAEARHFMCRDCANVSAKSIVDKSIARAAPMTCSVDLCEGELSHARLAKLTDDKVFADYSKKLNDVLELRVNQDWQLRLRAELQAQRRLLRDDLPREERIAAHRQHVCDRLLSLQCPSCDAVFVDFTDCFALECALCGTEFCAWCLANCGDSNAAHLHVAHCAKNITEPRSVFGSAQQFRDCHRQRREFLVRDYLQTSVPADLRDDVKRALATDLNDVGVAI